MVRGGRAWTILGTRPRGRSSPPQLGCTLARKDGKCQPCFHRDRSGVLRTRRLFLGLALEENRFARAAVGSSLFARTLPKSDGALRMSLGMVLTHAGLRGPQGPRLRRLACLPRTGFPARAARPFTPQAFIAAHDADLVFDPLSSAGFEVNPGLRSFNQGACRIHAMKARGSCCPPSIGGSEYSEPKKKWGALACPPTSSAMWSVVFVKEGWSWFSLRRVARRMTGRTLRRFQPAYHAWIR